MASFVLKVKSKNGQQIIKELSSIDKIVELRKILSKKCNIAESSLQVLHGFPPKLLCITQDDATLADSGVHSGDTLIVEEKVNSSKNDLGGSRKNEANGTSNPRSYSPTNLAFEDQLQCKGFLMQKVVPADNSCLFTSIGFVLSGKIDLNCGSFMRQLIVEHVRGDSETYSEAILGKPPIEYCDWILKSESWGGAIEISILAKYYGIEIAVVNAISGSINRFGEDCQYPHRVLLIFDGIHYDPLYLEDPQTGDTQTIFPSDDAQILIDAEQLAQESKSSRQFTDVNKFSIKCLDCHVILQGQTEAQAHAKSTNHVSFGEVS